MTVISFHFISTSTNNARRVQLPTSKKSDIAACAPRTCWWPNQPSPRALPTPLVVEIVVVVVVVGMGVDAVDTLVLVTFPVVLVDALLLVEVLLLVLLDEEVDELVLLDVLVLLLVEVLEDEEVERLERNEKRTGVHYSEDSGMVSITRPRLLPCITPSRLHLELLLIFIYSLLSFATQSGVFEIRAPITSSRRHAS